MRKTHPHRQRTTHPTSQLTLLAGAIMAGGCSGDYPLGDASETEPPLVGDEESAPAALADARVPAALDAPDFTIQTDDYLQIHGLASLGDLDGDGRDETAVSSYDPFAGVPFLHVRYGGPRPRNDLEVFAYQEEGARLAVNASGSGGWPIAASAGDVDGDGYGDFVVIASGCATESDWKGVYLVYGGPVRLTGTSALDAVAAHFVPTPIDLPREEWLDCGNPGLTVGTPGDIDGDGFDDLVLGATPPFDSDIDPLLGNGEGLYLFYGRSERFTGEVRFVEADATIAVEVGRTAFPLGDANGDGLADMLVAIEYLAGATNSPIYFVPGRTSRYNGPLDLATVGVRLEGVQHVDVDGARSYHTRGDLDGDGLSEVMVADSDHQPYLFYGAPGLFANGIDLSQADAMPPGSYGRMSIVADRDGDGDDELLDYTSMEAGPGPILGHTRDVVLLSGSRERLSGSFTFPESEVHSRHPDGPFPEDAYRVLSYAVPAGDIDGDGAAELFAVSEHREPTEDGGFRLLWPLIHVHYGRPAAPRGPR